MNDTSPEDSKTFLDILDKEIESYIRQASIVRNECFESTNVDAENLLETEGKRLSSFITDFQGLFTEHMEERDAELFNLYFETLFEAKEEYFIKGYLVARLGIHAGYNPYNWQYLAKKYHLINDTRTEEAYEPNP